MPAPVPAPPVDASLTVPGQVNTGTQAFGGTKLFTRIDIGTLTNLFGFNDLNIGGNVYVEDGAGVVGTNAVVVFGTPTNPLCWIVGGQAAASPLFDAKEFRLSDGNAVHYGVRVPLGNNGGRHYFGTHGVTLAADGNFLFKHSINGGAGVSSNIPTLVIKGDTGAANRLGDILQLQTFAGVVKHMFGLDGSITAAAQVWAQSVGFKFPDNTIQTTAAVASPASQILAAATLGGF